MKRLRSTARKARTANSITNSSTGETDSGTQLSETGEAGGAGTSSGSGANANASSSSNANVNASANSAGPGGGGGGAKPGDTGHLRQPDAAAVAAFLSPGTEHRSTTSLHGTPGSSGTKSQRGSSVPARRESRADVNANMTGETRQQSTPKHGHGSARHGQSQSHGHTQTHAHGQGHGHGLNFHTICSDWSDARAGSDGEELTLSDDGASVTVGKENTFPPIFNEFRKSRTLCDVILKTVDGQEFHAHRPILAASSPFFMALFSAVGAATRQESPATNNSGDDDFDANPMVVPLPSIGSKSLESLLEFMYTGQFQRPAQDSDLIALIPITMHLRLFGLLQQCRSWLLGHLTPDNAIAMFKLSKTHFCPSIQEEIKYYILQQFYKIAMTPEFTALEAELLEEFLRDDHLNAKSEECVFVAIRHWIEADPSPARLSKLADLLQCVRFGLMSFDYFTRCVYNWKYVRENPEVEQSLFHASLFLSQIESSPGAEADLDDPLARPRIPHEVIFAVGGWSAGSPTNFVETYDIRADRWFLTPYSDENPRAYHGLVTVDNLIYMVGGFDGQEHFNTMRCYNPMTKEWSEKACMHNPRCYVSCCVLGRHIYALGGFNGRLRMNTVERYDVDRNQWDMMPSMTKQRSDASAATLNGKIYIAGGFNGHEVLASVEAFDPVENQWTFIHPMHTARSGVTLTVHQGLLYAIGGFNGFTRLASGERYNPSAEPADWTPIQNMSTARSNFAVVSIDDWLFAIGGFNGTTTIPYCECYDAEKNEWYDICSMNLNRSALNACVLRGIRNAQDYTYLSRVHELLDLPPPSTGSPETASGRPRTRPRHPVS